jgi:small RNA 2'-O-methyltransferase
MVETIEHVDPGQLSRVEQGVFAQLRPAMLFMTTPNADYNPLLGLGAGEVREPDHRFEWGQAKFRRWALGVGHRNGYRVRFGGIGEDHAELGPPTQTACFTRAEVA